MVFVSVGSTRNDFTRLLVEVDRLVEIGLLHDVHAQIGLSSYVPHHMVFDRFLPRAELLSRIESADFIISHAGTGTVDTCLGLKKKLILFPRRVEFGEHPDNHQLELGEYLASRNRVLLVQEVEELEGAIARIDTWTPTFREQTGESDVKQVLREFLRESFSHTDPVYRKR